MKTSGKATSFFGGVKKKSENVKNGSAPEFKAGADRYECIAQLAYEMYEKRGREHGMDFDDWLEAERQMVQDKIFEI